MFDRRTRPIFRRAIATSIAASAIVSGAASADTAGARAPDPAVVELYKQARELVNAGRWDEGCPKFEQAMVKQPTASILVNVGDCHEHAGKLARALEDYEVARGLNRETREPARRTAIDAEIEARVKKIGPRVPRLRIVVERAVAGMVVRRNGEVLRDDVLGAEVRVDPGAYEVTAEAPGHEVFARKVVLAEGATERVTVSFVARSFAAQHTASLVLAGGAVALAGAGAGLAGWTVATHSSLREVCRTGAEPECADRKGALEVGSIATNVAFAAAGAAALSAVLVFVLAERPRSPAVQATISGSSASVRVAW